MKSGYRGRLADRNGRSNRNRTRVPPAWKRLFRSARRVAGRDRPLACPTQSRRLRHVRNDLPIHMVLAMRAGTLIDYKLRVRSLPLRWRTLIKEWQPPHRFVDEQVRGPYQQWIHEHTFEPRDGGTVARDHIRYAVPFDWLLHRWFVRPDIEKISRFREEALTTRFPPMARSLT